MAKRITTKQKVYEHLHYLKIELVNDFEETGNLNRIDAVINSLTEFKKELLNY